VEKIMTHFSDGVRVGRTFGIQGSGVLPGAPVSPVFIYDVVPAALVTNGICTQQTLGAAGNAVLNGSLASGGAVVLDVPRNIIIDAAGAATAVLTITGTSVYGGPMSEAITLNGTTAVAGKKAFKTITRIASSAAATDFFVGTGDVFGLPYRADSRGYVLTSWNSAFVTTGTFVAADTTAATTTTGDVRGTYAVPDAADATKRLTLWMYIEDPDTLTGLYGVTQA
jgi:hypothetical protein